MKLDLRLFSCGVLWRTWFWLGGGLSGAMLAPAQPQLPPAVHGLINASNYTGTETCLICHGSSGWMGQAIEAEVMATTHWTWIHTNTPAVGAQVMGKRNIINNYCVAVASNEPRCTSCHIGQGWRDNSFDFTDSHKIDCLVCHDTTGTYKKTPTGAGLPDPSVDLVRVAQNAGRTSRATCGACHFYGGGADAVKHGDLDSTMANPLRSVDVHMGVDGANMSCVECHASMEPGATPHDLVGSRYSKRAPDNWLCEDCHSPTPHWGLEQGVYYNAHTGRVSCQACHIPHFARGGRATKMTWDWSTAGVKKPDGSDLVIKNAAGDPIYDTKKGSFTWESNVVPEYVWFNGDVIYQTMQDPVDAAALVTINQLQGTRQDGQARIVPVKRFLGIQPYDPVNQLLAVPHLFPTNGTDAAAYWKGYNWTNAVATGMAAVGLPFSGQVGWINTEMFWIQNHMVAPKEQALTCVDCHQPGGRLDFSGLGYPADRAAVLSTLVGFDIALEAAGPGVQLRWLGAPGYRYQVQSNVNLSDPHGWTDEVGGVFTPAAAQDLVWGATGVAEGGKFYRVVRVVVD
jgi:octaheme c-type cytochrome (tetrathionate reductase family)